MKHLYYFLLILLGMSCAPIPVDENDADKSDSSGAAECQVELLPDNRDNIPLTYPLVCFVFDEDGNMVRRQHFADKTVPLTLTLAKGSYQISLLSGFDEADYNLPLVLTDKGLIKLKSDKGLARPLILSETNVQVSRNTQVHFPLLYMVSSVAFGLAGVPEDVNRVRILVSPFSGGFSLTGQYAESSMKIGVECQKEGNVWMSTPVYVFPMAKKAIDISIILERKGTDEQFHATYKELSVATPYVFSGNYDRLLTMNVEHGMEQWQPEVVEEFDLEDTGGNTTPPSEGEDTPSQPVEEPTDEAGLETITLDAMPEEGDLIGRAWVWKLTPVVANQAEAILISPHHSEIVASEYGAAIASEDYMGLHTWRTFTTEEVKEFRQTYSDYLNLAELNNVMNENNLPVFYRTSTARYFCNDGKNTFSLMTTTISAPGSSRKYYLRPVVKVKLKVKTQ